MPFSFREVDHLGPYPLEDPSRSLIDRPYKWIHDQGERIALENNSINKSSRIERIHQNFNKFKCSLRVSLLKVQISALAEISGGYSRTMIRQ